MKRRLRWRRLEGDYHAFNRGARGLRIFSDDGDRGYFLRLIGLTAKKHAVLVTAWCLMDNHYHLGLRADGARMGRMVRDLEKTYARYYNKKTGHVGALFEGRFGSVWLPDVESLAYVTRYIHANCRDKGERPEAFLWSSCRTYLGLTAAPDWLCTAPVLAWAGGVEAYRRYLAEVPPRRAKGVEEDVVQAEFLAHLQDRVARAWDLAVPPPGLTRKAATAWVALRQFGLRPRVVAPHLGYSTGHCLSNVVSRLDRRMDAEPALRTLLNGLLAK